MIIAQATLSFLVTPPTPWADDWLLLPLIVLTVIIHVLGLGIASQKTIQICGNILKRRPKLAFTLVIGTMTLLATVLHAIEAWIWAVAYYALGVVPNFKAGVLYSLGAMTTYGHETQTLEEKWRLMGAMEALNGWLLFGLSSAFIFWLIQEVSPKNQASR
jgi:hypothetical protein